MIPGTRETTTHARPCGATRRAIQDPGWECTGRGLIVVCTVNAIPVVLPARALEIVDPESWWVLPVVPFAGGDHYHLVVPRRPPARPFVTDTVMALGDVAISARSLGVMKDGGQVWIGGAQ